jgi:signal transduction histidine kinase
VGKLTALKLLLPAATGLRVLQRPSWLTPERLLAGVGLLSLGLIVLVAWVLTVSKKNAALKELIHAREQAQRQLQEAHDTLEQKVAERSAQLQVEMTARKTAELQFKAVLAERTRLARDLHDTLEQTLTGIALRLDTSAKLAPRDPATANDHLQLARNWLHQSQVDLRRSIWDLRSRELEQFDLSGALRRSAEQLVDGTEIGLQFRTEGTPQGLPEVVEENVLRIGQEALTNIAKHARATRVGILLQFDPRMLSLRVEDNGLGFEHREGGLPPEGHFGLRGMSERAKRLAGGIVIHSVLGRGTTITVEIPLEPGGMPSRSEPVGGPTA